MSSDRQGASNFTGRGREGEEVTEDDLVLRIRVVVREVVMRKESALALLDVSHGVHLDLVLGVVSR
ncbi:hypothetical protein D3C72_2315980 [compost metagenome]